jgi:hypothetical protein
MSEPGQKPRRRAADLDTCTHTAALRHGACQIGPGPAGNGFRVAIVPPCGARVSWSAEVGGKREMAEMEVAERKTDLDLDMDLDMDMERKTSAEARRPATERPHAALPCATTYSPPHSHAHSRCSTAGLGCISHPIIYRLTTKLGIQVRPHLHLAGAHVRIPRPVRRSRCSPASLGS